MQVSKLRARMQFLRDNVQPAVSQSEKRQTEQVLSQETEATVRQTADHERRERLESNSLASSSQATTQALTKLDPARRLPVPLESSVDPGSSWDRRFRHSNTAPLPTCSMPPSASAPVRQNQPAAQQTDILQQGARSIAQVK